MPRIRSYCTKGDSRAVGTLAIERAWQGSIGIRIDNEVRLLTMIANILGQALKLRRTNTESQKRTAETCIFLWRRFRFCKNVHSPAMSASLKTVCGVPRPWPLPA